MKLVLLHGRSQQNKEEAKLKEEWIDSLERGLQKSGLTLNLSEDDIIFPYYGNLLIDLIDNRNNYQKDVIEKGAGGLDPEYAAFCSQFLEEVAINAGISDQQIAEFSKISITEKGPLNWPWVLAMLRKIDSEYSFGQSTLWAFTNDVFHYLKNPIIRRKIDDFVKSFLPEEECVWVGHSLGSVISYNILSTYKAKTIKEIITLGSPLGMKVIKKNLKSPLIMPLCSTNGWYNAFDKNDTVSLFPLIDPHFYTDPAITNNGKVLNDTSNKHGITGYLKDKEVALRIYNALTNKM
ncbi:hypothetical protein WH221_05945 [Chryseobacterium culicis]|uniref:Alpha/beta hydrolase n=1 Tax=Chryseobacterium culicis TaxID=680127 RepID=A0A2S9CZA3_CHRCI|nr:hypothetical protein [Chryseobacterium culicis]PRB85790.1 hypothetical protein CQ022_05910 [Chryseobacterium culicis]PRB90486.1 hypothetical protein CQ033_07075 [Chryseobacterium culicis]